MKKLLLLPLLACSFLLSQAQFTPMPPEQFLQLSVPAPPNLNAVCNSSGQQKNDYREKMNKLVKAAEAQTAYLKKDEKKNAATMEQQAKQQIATQYGLSAADMQQLQSGKMSKEEKKAMADKMLQQSSNISIDEVKGVSKMNKAEQTEWSGQYMAEQKAAADKNPAQYQATQAKNKSLFELTQEKDVLYRKLSAEQEAFGKQFGELETDKTAQTLLKEIDALRTKYMSLVGVDYGQGKEMNALAESIKAKKATYCSMQTKRYLEILGRYRESVEKNFPEYDRLEVLTNEANKLTTGSTVQMMEKGFMNYQQIEAYLKFLKDAYQYSIYDTGQPF